MLKQKLQQKLLQKLSPQQIQLIKLLEVPTVQLEQRIKKEIEENPILEEGDDTDDDSSNDDFDLLEDASDSDEFENESEYNSEQDEFSLEDYIEDDETPAYKLQANNFSKDDKHDDIPLADGNSFQEYLEAQLGLRSLNPKQHILAHNIIGNIDEDGYLRRDLEAMTDDIAFGYNIQATEEELIDVLRIVQDFDPPGIGARDLQECLLIQLKKRNPPKSPKPAITLAYQILDDYFNEFTKKHYDKIIMRLGIKESDLKAAIDEVLKLNPKPGSAFTGQNTKISQHIIPDFILDVNNGVIQLSLNSKNSPELRINKTYSEMLQAFTSGKRKKTKQEKDAILFVKQKLDSAKWFIDAIKQRQNTLMLTMNAIIDYQKEYFIDGDEKKLKPMILKDIAEKTTLDISTISRVANSKYIQTHFGIFALKYFFSEGMQTESGEEVSTREIKMILQESIESESKRRPLTDERLAKILQEKGYQIARRTVAKYREQLNISVARLRKEL
jgi:RNA polymerase sigma-54 factor